MQKHHRPEACIYADGVRSIRQKEYDNSIYILKEAELQSRTSAGKQILSNTF